MSDESCQKPAAADLGALQRWMQAVISHPAGIAAGLADESAQAEVRIAPEDVESVILRSQSLSSVERLAVYGNAYYARLIECLESMFPALVVTLEKELFDEFAFAYLQQFPSTSYTLDRLADHFVEFLEASRSELDDGSSRDGSPSWPEFLIDLARFEHAVGEVFDGPGSEEMPQLAAESLAAVAPDAWGDVRLTPSPSLRLVSFRFPLNEYYTAMRSGEEAPMPAAEPAYLALWRRNYIVRRLPLTREQYSLLAEILRGQSLGEALSIAAEVSTDFDTFAASLSTWFHDWSAAGFFTGLEPARPLGDGGS